MVLLEYSLVISPAIAIVVGQGPRSHADVHFRRRDRTPRLRGHQHQLQAVYTRRCRSGGSRLVGQSCLDSACCRQLRRIFSYKLKVLWH